MLRYRHENTKRRSGLSEMPPYRLGRHWNTIQAYLIPGIEDDIGELSIVFMLICVGKYLKIFGETQGAL